MVQKIFTVILTGDEFNESGPAITAAAVQDNDRNNTDIQ